MSAEDKETLGKLKLESKTNGFKVLSNNRLLQIRAAYSNT